MSKNKMVKKKKRKISVQDKYYDTSKVDLRDTEDLNEILRRLKEYHIKDAFEICNKLNMGLKQICVMLFKSNKGGLDSKYIHGTFLTHFVNPKNECEQVTLSIFKEPIMIKFLEEGSEDKPLKIGFLEININNAVMFTFTEFKNKIDVEMILLEGDNYTAFDYYRDVRFINPHDYGYVPYIFRSEAIGLNRYCFKR